MSQAHLHHDRSPSLSMAASTTPESPIGAFRYIDIILLVLAAPILLLIGVSASGYCIAAGAWIVLRGVGVVIERHASGTPDLRRQVGLRMAYMLGRLFALALVIVFIRKGYGQDAGLAALIVIVAAFTIHLGISAATRPRRR